LQDYNNIFNLVTVPNLFLTWYVTEHELSDEVAVTPDLKSRFLAKLNDLGIEFEFLVSAWGGNLIVPPVISIILTSETSGKIRPNTVL